MQLLGQTFPRHDPHLLRQVAAEPVYTTVTWKAAIYMKDIESRSFVLKHTVPPPLIPVITSADVLPTDQTQGSRRYHRTLSNEYNWWIRISPYFQGFILRMYYVVCIFIALARVHSRSRDDRSLEN